MEGEHDAAVRRGEFDFVDDGGFEVAGAFLDFLELEVADRHVDIVGAEGEFHIACLVPLFHEFLVHLDGVGPFFLAFEGITPFQESHLVIKVAALVFAFPGDGSHVVGVSLVAFLEGFDGVVVFLELEGGVSSVIPEPAEAGAENDGSLGVEAVGGLGEDGVGLAPLAFFHGGDGLDVEITDGGLAPGRQQGEEEREKEDQDGMSVFHRVGIRVEVSGGKVSWGGRIAVKIRGLHPISQEGIFPLPFL